MKISIFGFSYSLVGRARRDYCHAGNLDVLRHPYADVLI